jgi:asparagine synthase (glutamine-hydrolysing)
VWGNVTGHRRDGTYERRDPDEPAAAYCARLYDESGSEFVYGLNGDFVGVVYDRDESTVSVFTDRLGTWPIHVTEADDGAVVFSSHIQSLAQYPGLSLAFDEEYVVQNLSRRGGPFGTKTPLEGVETVPPGSVTTYDLEDGTKRVDTYWRPTFAHDGFDRYSAFVDEFVERFQASIAERTQDRSKRYGILLSGGSDARLIMAALDDDLDVTAYHMGGWMSKEVRIAERIALTKGIDFRLLRRDPEYFGRVLDRSPAMWNFQQLFNQAWAEGFIDDIRSEVDVLLTGHFSDTLFKGTFVPSRFADLGPLGTFEVPTELSITSKDEYQDELGAWSPSFVDSDVDLSAVFERNVIRTDEGVEAYGIEFDSFRDFVLGRLHVPATTDPLFRQSLRENLELQMPMYDNRLLDLWVDMPTEYKLRRNVVNSAVAALDPELADIPHAKTGLPLTRSRTTHRLGVYPMNALRQLSPFEAVPAEHLGHHPWGNHGALIREQSHVEDAIYESEDLIRSLPFLDWDRVVECYEAHLDGANNTKLLYRLVTFLEAPLTRQIAGLPPNGGDGQQESKIAMDDSQRSGSALGTDDD